MESSRRKIGTLQLIHLRIQGYRAENAFDNCSDVTEAEYLVGKFLPIFEQNPFWQQFILGMRKEIVEKNYPQPYSEASTTHVERQGCVARVNE